MILFDRISGHHNVHYGVVPSDCVCVYKCFALVEFGMNQQSHQCTGASTHNHIACAWRGDLFVLFLGPNVCGALWASRYRNVCVCAYRFSERMLVTGGSFVCVASAHSTLLFTLIWLSAFGLNENREETGRCWCLDCVCVICFALTHSISPLCGAWRLSTMHPPTSNPPLHRCIAISYQLQNENEGPLL